jgi:hypothetical protein
MIPAHIRIGKSEWKTSLFPKDGCYIVPIKASIRQAENLREGDKVIVRVKFVDKRTGYLFWKNSGGIR